jgi:hypothetical protein
MKKLLIILCVLFSSTLFAQKPMVGFTQEEIKHRNRLEFKITEWDVIRQDEYWVMYTVSPYLNMTTFYFFRYGGTKNFLASHSTQDDDVAVRLYQSVMKSHHHLGDNKFLSKENNLICQYNFYKETGSHSFIYFTSEDKNIFKN